MDGVLLVNKPAGVTSHDVVAAVRRASGVKRVGHTGTLDPMATGLLVLCLGKATRIAEYITNLSKTYRAGTILGETTDTQDSTGATISTQDASLVTAESFRETCGEFVGSIRQTPPMVSALKRDGKPLYWYARKGETVEREAREIDIHSIQILEFIPGTRAEAELEVRCSSGTYIRTLCADIGQRLGCGAVMSSLCRTQIGQLSLDDSLTLEETKELCEAGALSMRLLPIRDALVSMPAVTISTELLSRFCNGMAVAVSSENSALETVRVISQSGDIVGIGQIRVLDGALAVAPHKVLMECTEVAEA